MVGGEDADVGQVLFVVASLHKEFFDLQTRSWTVHLGHAEVHKDEFVVRLTHFESLQHHLLGFLAVAAKVSSEVKLVE